MSWLKSFEDNIDVPVKLESDLEGIESNPDYFEYIPIFTSTKKINPKHYLTGDVSCKIYDNIDGKKTINQITEELKVEHNKVFNICKNLVKMGFLSFT